MATKVDGWRAETDGNLFASEKAATAHDISMLALSMAQGDQVLADKIEPALISHADQTIKLLTCYVKCHPQARKSEESGAQNAQEGPAKKGPAPCAAKQMSDQMVCKVCGLTWDVNDSNPPNCNRPREGEDNATS